LHALREARNEVHIETKPKRRRQFSEADAIAGLGALIHLVAALTK